jgi:hypothetical protein
MTTTIAIKDRLAPGMEEGLERLPGVSLLTDAPASALLVADAVLPLEVRRVDPLTAKDPALAAPAGAALLLVVEGLLSEQDALVLEDRGVGFVDATGRAWSPGVRRTSLPTRRRRRYAPLIIRAANSSPIVPTTHGLNTSWPHAQRSVSARPTKR